MIIQLLKKNNECGFHAKLSDAQVKSLTPLTDKLYVVAQLNNPKSTLSFSHIFQSTDPKTRNRLGLDGETTDFVDGLKKLLSLRRHYVAETHFSKIKDLDSSSLTQLLEKRNNAEAAWLGISNLSMQQFLNYKKSSSAGEFRAVAFYQDLISRKVQSTETYDQRIAELEKKRDDDREKKIEIEMLRKLKKSHEQLIDR